MRAARWLPVRLRNLRAGAYVVCPNKTHLRKASTSYSPSPDVSARARPPPLRVSLVPPAPAPPLVCGAQLQRGLPGAAALLPGQPKGSRGLPTSTPWRPPTPVVISQQASPYQRATPCPHHAPCQGL